MTSWISPAADSSLNPRGHTTPHAADHPLLLGATPASGVVSCTAPALRYARSVDDVMYRQLAQARHPDGYESIRGNDRSGNRPLACEPETGDAVCTDCATDVTGYPR